MEGTGKLKFLDSRGGEFEGTFVINILHIFRLIQGKLTYPTGEVLDGMFDEYRMLHGGGVMTSCDGTVCQGKFVHGFLRGIGTLGCINGDVYSGTFENGKMNGECEVAYANGDHYSGNIQNFTRVDEGVLTKADGRQYTGVFHDGELFGRGMLRMKSGDVQIGVFVHGKLFGEGRINLAMGGSFSGNFVAGKIHGKGTFVENGDKFEAFFGAKTINQCRRTFKNSKVCDIAFHINDVRWIIAYIDIVDIPIRVSLKRKRRRGK